MVRIVSSGSNAIIDCYNNFTLQGHNNLTCQSNQTWNYPVPRCGICILIFYTLLLQSYTPVLPDKSHRFNSKWTENQVYRKHLAVIQLLLQIKVKHSMEIVPTEFKILNTFLLNNRQHQLFLRLVI